MKLGISPVKPAVVENKVGQTVNAVKAAVLPNAERQAEKVSPRVIDRPLTLEMEDIVSERMMYRNRMTGKVSYISTHVLDSYM